MVGFIDLVDDQGNILDIKTRSRTPSQQEVDKDFQLTVYSWLYRNFTGNAEAGVGLDCVVEKKRRRSLEFRLSEQMQILTGC